MMAKVKTTDVEGMVSQADPIPAIDIDGLTVDVPRGAWVAISENLDRCVAHGDTVEEVMQRAEAEGERKAIITRVPKDNAVLVL